MKVGLAIVIGYSLLSVLGASLNTSFGVGDTRQQDDDVAVYIPPSREAPYGGYPGGATRLYEPLGDRAEV